jgi:hypothetical protein
LCRDQLRGTDKCVSARNSRARPMEDSDVDRLLATDWLLTE